MAQSAATSDRKLLKAARAMVERSGVGGLRLRAVARQAGVNLGLFHYHFGTKRAFVRRLLQDVYDEFFGRLSLESSGHGDAAARLRRALLVFGRFARDQRKLFVVLLAEALQGDKDVISYLETNIPRHAAVVAALVREGQRAGALKAMPVPVAVSFALGGMGVPNIFITVIERGASAGTRRGLNAFRQDFLSDDAIERRADLVLAALAR